MTGQRRRKEDIMNSPREKADLVPLARALLLKLKVVHSPPRFEFREVVEKILVFKRRGLLVNDDLGVGFVEFVQDVLVCLA
jgi:hypothetical protein